MWREEVIGTEMLVLAVVGEVASRRVSTGTFALRSSSRIPALKLAKTRPFCETDLRGIHLPSPFQHACPVPGEQWGKTGHKPGPAGPAERGFMGQVSPRLSVCKAARSCRYKAEHLFKKREGEGEKHIHLLIKKKKNPIARNPAADGALYKTLAILSSEVLCVLWGALLRPVEQKGNLGGRGRSGENTAEQLC